MLANTPNPYSNEEMSGVLTITVASALSLSAVLGLLLFKSWRHKTYHQTHIIAYYCSMLVSNALQAVGSLINIKWVSIREVEPGNLCGWQGGLKQAGNVGIALWSFMIALHCFNLLFLRLPSTKFGLYMTLIFGWCAVASVVLAGPFLIETTARGPYFSVSGAWCWISANYNTQRTYLEYFIEFLSAGLSLMLYTAVLLRVRGNLVCPDGKWHFRWVTQDQSWQLSIGRDIIDTVMLKVAKQMVWFPIAYTLIIVPVAVARLAEFAGGSVPYALTATAASIFNLGGFVNVMLLLTTMKVMPDASNLPEFTTPRHEINPDSPTALGITPFTLPKEEYPAPKPRHSQRSLVTRYEESVRTVAPNSARLSMSEKSNYYGPASLARQASDASTWSAESHVARPQTAVVYK